MATATKTAAAKPRRRVKAKGVPSPAVRLTPRAAYMRGEQVPTFTRWRPTLRDSNSDISAARTMAAARAIEAVQNSGWLQGCVELSTGFVVGGGLTLNAKPNATALGWTQDQANEWSRKVEARFSMWADSPRACDAGARYTFGDLSGMAYAHWMGTGEILATLPFRRREGSQWGTKVNLLPAWNLKDKTDEQQQIIQGVRIDDLSAPISYVIESKKNGIASESERPAYDMFGRPQTIHVITGVPGQVRGITPFVSVLKVVKQFDQLQDATLTAAIIQAIFAAMFKSPAPQEEVVAGLQSDAEQDELTNLVTQKVDWYNQTDLNLGIYGKILHGFPGDELDFFRSETPNTTYQPFVKFLLREIARAGGITYEAFSGDYEGATFSSIKMGTSVTWPMILNRRRMVSMPFCQRVYEAWLEEDVENGGTEFPDGVEGFQANREAAVQAFWRGPAKPQADDLKAALAAKELRGIGVPDQVLYDELGGDFDDWAEQIRREKDRREALGLDDPSLLNSPQPPANGGGNRGNEEDEDESEDEDDEQVNA